MAEKSMQKKIKYLIDKKCKNCGHKYSAHGQPVLVSEILSDNPITEWMCVHATKRKSKTGYCECETFQE